MVICYVVGLRSHRLFSIELVVSDPPVTHAHRHRRRFSRSSASEKSSAQVSEGRLSVYLDGQLANCFEGIDPAQLRMGPRLVVLGGGKVQYSHK
mmetsp:Transcript_74190/g.197905  ORF Transcript_74190/g.197905 Transcript_74190/m.197905 type:complete len:94 (-) Transcript_74190:601-882(-)